MTDTQAPAAPPSTPSGWFTDPADATRLRWWNGTNWTEHVQVPPPQPNAEEIAAAQAAASAAQQRAVEAAYVPFTHNWNAEQDVAVGENWRGSAQTFPAWLLAFAPIWIAGSGFGVSLLALAVPIPVPVRAGLTIAIALFLVCALANLDAKRLATRGYRRSTSPFWAILLPVFFILRTIRVGVRGLPAAIVAWLLCLIIGASVVLAVFLPLYLYSQQQAAQSNQAAGTGTTSSLAPISSSERAYELTPTGMAARLTHDISMNGKGTVPPIACKPLPSTAAGAMTSCQFQNTSLKNSTFWVVVTPESPTTAFQTTAPPPSTPAP
jgi:hypothetical protein